MISVNPLLKVLYEIELECADVLQQKQEEERAKNLDEFDWKKTRIAEKIRTIKKELKERDELFKRGKTNAVAKKSGRIRQMIEELKVDAEEFRKMQKKREKRYKKKIENDPKIKETMEKEATIIALTYKHIEECIKMERNYGGTKAQDTEELFTDKKITDEDIQVGEIVVQGLPDIDDPQFQLLRKNDAVIVEGLDEILQGVQRLKAMAQDIHDELIKQEPLVEELHIRVERAGERLVTLNAQLTKTLKKARPVKKCCCDCILILAILGLVVAIIFVVR